MLAMEKNRQQAGQVGLMEAQQILATSPGPIVLSESLCSKQVSMFSLIFFVFFVFHSGSIN